MLSLSLSRRPPPLFLRRHFEAGIGTGFLAANSVITAQHAACDRRRNILATLIYPTCGRASLGGFNGEHDPGRARRPLGYHTGGEEGFYSRLSGLENLAFFAAMNDLTTAEARDRIALINRWASRTTSTARCAPFRLE
jgi:hypothetical protein